MSYRYTFTPLDTAPGTYLFGCRDHRLRLDFLAPDLIRVALYREGVPLLPTWSVCPGDSVMPPQGRERLSREGFDGFAPQAEAGEDAFSFTLPGRRLTLDLHTPAVAVYEGDKLLCRDRPLTPYNLEGELGVGSWHVMDRELFGESIYGLGDRAGDVDRAGRSFTLGARDCLAFDAASTDPLYKHIPFFLCRNSTGTYGVFYDTHAQGRFDFGRELNQYYDWFKSFSCDDDALVYYLFLGDLPHITRRFAWLCGRTAFPPKWTLDYCGSTMAYTEAPDADAQLRGFLRRCREHRLTCSGFYLSSGYTSIGEHRCVFHWNTQKIPDPDDLCRTFEEAGVHLLPNIKPAFLTQHPLYDTLARQGLFLHYADGTPALLPFWGGWGSYLDFTNPAAFDFWVTQVREQLLSKGVTATWNDNNEYHIADPAILAHGFGRAIPACRICQVFPMLMVMASHAAQCQLSQDRQMLSTRSGGAGYTRLAQSWSGDNRTVFADLRYNHKLLMGASLSGLFVFAHDIGGFAGPMPDPELFLRWLQYGVLLPRFCIHSWNTDGSVTEPWTYPQLMDEVLALFALRQRLKPLLYHLLYRAHAHYEPMVAPVFYRYPDYDPESDLFLLGPDLLAGCVFDRGAETLTVDLPENDGGWYLEDTHCLPGVHTLPCPVRGLPLLFARAGSVLPWDVSPYGSDAPDLLFTVYPIPQGVFTAHFFDDDGHSFAYRQGECVQLTFTVTCTADAVRVSTRQLGRRTFLPQFRLVDVQDRPLIVT